LIFSEVKPNKCKMEVI